MRTPAMGLLVHGVCRVCGWLLPTSRLFGPIPSARSWAEETEGRGVFLAPSGAGPCKNQGLCHLGDGCQLEGGSELLSLPPPTC